jgi:hypothetical protein
VDPASLLDRVLDDEGITAGLDEAEAMTLLRVVSDRVRSVAAATNDAAAARREVNSLCREARKIADAVAAEDSAKRPKVLQRLLDELGRRPN